MKPANALSTAALFAAGVAVMLPWLNPFAPGPSPAVGPLLVSFGATVFLFLVAFLYAFPDGLTSKKTVLQNCWLPIAIAWLLAGVLSTLISLLQYFGLAHVMDPWISQTRWPGEAYANLRQRNLFASLTNISLAALVFIALKTSGVGSKYGNKLPGLWLTAAGLLAVGNAISSSRTGLVELVLLCILYGVWGKWREPVVRRVLVCSVLVYAIAVFAMPYLAGLDLSTHGAIARMDNNERCGSRLTLWSNVLHLIAQKPWFGWGLGELDYAHFITLYNEPRFCDILDNAHSLPLHLAVELGVPFALLICGGFGWWVVSQKPWAEADPTRQMAWTVLAVILLHSMLEYPLWYGPFQMAFGICLLLLWRQKPTAETKNSPKKVINRPLALILYAQAATVLIAFILYAAWDYNRISQIYLQPESRNAAYRNDTLNKIRSSWLFADQVRFAELLVTPLTQANAEWTFNTATTLLHYSPEPRVVERLIESAVMLGRDDEAIGYLARYKAAFPKEPAVCTIDPAL